MNKYFKLVLGIAFSMIVTVLPVRQASAQNVYEFAELFDDATIISLLNDRCNYVTNIDAKFTARTYALAITLTTTLVNSEILANYHAYDSKGQEFIYFATNIFPEFEANKENPEKTTELCTKYKPMFVERYNSAREIIESSVLRNVENIQLQPLE
jgi:hypothetical protein